ncbi:hypothetical protein MNBD_GAMMA24-2666 [hydrothermal vent metagenome]|uniref:Uncharacterized protein n=1 Tax=hydrothermal vent metagenome TaxID=652676 RepID=A0A3B1BDK8_9ZZZZ
MTRNYMTPNEVAKLLMVSPVTVRQWAQKGWLKASTTAGGHRRFLYHDVEQFARERNLAFLSPRHPIPRILIVDDNRQLVNFLLELFSNMDNPPQTEVAYNGFNAGLKVQSFKPDILLLDLMMPGLDGFEVCAQIKSDPASRTLRIIAMTGYPSTQNIERIIHAGAEICFSKPLDTTLLLNTIGLTGKSSTTL